MTTEAQPTYLTIRETAERLRCSQDTIRRRLKSGELAGVFFAGQWKIAPAAIDEMLERAKWSRP